MTSREKIAFGLGWVAVLLRLASDSLFPGGGPISYQLLQSAFLALGIAFLWPNLDAIFLRNGQHQRSIREGLVALPIGLLLGTISAYGRFGAPEWPTIGQAIAPVAYNVFFTALEELEFRGFLLALLLRLGGRVPTAVWLQALLHTLAHTQRLWHGYLLSLVGTLLITLWFGFLALRTRSLWGPWVGHLSWNVAILLTEFGNRP